MNKFKAEAVKMREAGYSYGMINEKLGVPKGTLSEWFKAKPFNPNKEVLRRIQYGPIRTGEISHNKKVREVLRMRSIGRGEIGVLSKRDLHMLGLGLYIGGGAKAFEHIDVANSNPEVIKLIVRWFKEALNLDTANIVIAIHIYPNNNEKEAVEFWKKITWLPLENFRKTYVDIRKDKSKFRSNKLPYGTAYIKVVSNGDPEKGVRLHRKLQGWMEAVLPKID